MKKELKHTLRAVQVSLLILWPTCAWAATITFGTSLASIPLLAVLMTLTLSTLSGTTALLHTIKQEYEKNGEVKRIWLLVAWQMFGSNTAGVAMFFAAEAMGMEDSKQAMAIIIAAFSGNFGLQRALQFFANKYAPEPKP